MPINRDYQKLEPGNTIRLFEVDGTKFGGVRLRYHSHNVPLTSADVEELEKRDDVDEDQINGLVEAGTLYRKSIWWQGEEFVAWPCQVEGIDASTDGTSAQPKLSVANLNGTITALCLAFDDMLQFPVTIHDTLSHYLDARNFPDGNPTADPTQEKVQVYFIDGKNREAPGAIEFILSSPMDLQGKQIPSRQMHALCEWAIRNQYRSGDGCDYSGKACFDKFNHPVDDPAQDTCPGTLSACKIRFGADNLLPFGGFPGTSLLKG
ncbi:phage minor tail protein L [Pantoea coffeiphila]|uniref:Phage minor tail protein L n=1 Tax=Pantoea coffeiphila TaxID=1465635 RepID=A0A2S9I848_9GAMM|nr:phage minor tail protein L [Pantoea coffeiphila]PRD13970.1 phage minor tail protein L [Pantoea coffeiphila]